MRVLLTGGTGMIGQATQRLAPEIAPHVTLLAPSRAELPLQDAATVADWLARTPVDAVIHAAARVGGIQANVDYPVEFLVENVRINDAVIMGAHAAGVERLIFLGSSCMYPRDYRQPLAEDDVLAAPLEPTNEGYALSKIVGSRLCAYLSRSHTKRAYRTFIPCNLFGPEDHFGSAASHLIAAIVTKVVDARDSGAQSVEIWGSGQARREFLYSDDLVAFLLDSLDRLAALPDLLNVGRDMDYTVDEYYRMVADIAGYDGTFHHDLTRPEGMTRKLMTSARARAHGWNPQVDMAEGMSRVVQAYEAVKRGRTN